MDTLIHICTNPASIVDIIIARSTLIFFTHKKHNNTIEINAGLVQMCIKVSIYLVSASCKRFII